MYKQHGRSVHLKLLDDLAEHERQSDLLVEHTADREIDGAKGSQALQLLDGLFMQLHAMNGIAADLRQRVQDSQFAYGQLAGQGHGDEHDSDNSVLRVQRDARPPNPEGNMAAIRFGHVFCLLKLVRDDSFSLQDDQAGDALPESESRSEISIVHALLHF